MDYNYAKQKPSLTRWYHHSTWILANIAQHRSIRTPPDQGRLLFLKELYPSLQLCRPTTHCVAATLKPQEVRATRVVEQGTGEKEVDSSRDLGLA